jgi:hypothetical protein
MTSFGEYQFAMNLHHTNISEVGPNGKNMNEFIRFRSNAAPFKMDLSQRTNTELRVYAPINWKHYEHLENDAKEHKTTVSDLLIDLEEYVNRANILYAFEHKAGPIWTVKGRGPPKEKTHNIRYVVWQDHHETSSILLLRYFPEHTGAMFFNDYNITITDLVDRYISSNPTLLGMFNRSGYIMW